MAKVIVGMSGGVDSAVAAFLLKSAGYDVVGVTLRTWQSQDGQESRCCEIDDARRTAWQLGIPYHTLNCISCFESSVVQPFISEYICGRTPNPCTICNRDVKWERMLYMAKVLKADYIATGHYASVVKLDNGRYTFKKAVHSQKDQTYMLYRLTQDQIAATLMPLGGFSKEVVREIARKAQLPVFEKPDSQEICFVSEGKYADFIEENAHTQIPGQGLFIDTKGNILGTHKGIIHYTVGQRRGLGLPLGYPAYVKEIRPDNNEVVIGKEQDLYCRAVICEDINFMSIDALKENEKLHCTVKIRYHHSEQEAIIENAGDNRIQVSFDRPVRAATPGQAAVFYDENECLIGGGVISEVMQGLS